MKTRNRTTLALLTLLALGTSALVASAQDNNGGPNGNGPRRPGMRGHRPPVPAIIRALDANHDGVIDAQEIANAPAALKSLDKNGDGKLTPNEFMGPRPPRRGGPGGPPGRGAWRNPGAEGHRLPPGPPPGDNNGAPSGDNGMPPGPPPGGE